MRTLTQDQVNEMIKEHWKHGETGGKEGKIADFSNCEICNYDFSDEDLEGAIFTNATIINCKFINTELVKADFSYASVFFTSFYNARMAFAKFASANIHCSNFKYTDLRHAALNVQNADYNISMLFKIWQKLDLFAARTERNYKE